jgi:hypothetical protein
MIRAIGTLALFGALAFLGLGAIFLIAGGSGNLFVGGILICFGIALLAITCRMVRAEAERPIQVNQNVQIGGSGTFVEKSVHCPGCGGNMAEKDIKLKDGGLIITCPFCGKVSVLEEEPKW